MSLKRVKQLWSIAFRLTKSKIKTVGEGLVIVMEAVRFQILNLRNSAYASLPVVIWAHRLYVESKPLLLLNVECHVAWCTFRESRVALGTHRVGPTIRVMAIASK